ncbi:LacI family DNA-binding transcriptional regulator [Pantoea sp. Acro-805]|jgi:LacI family transcriptional regulator|uniref:LacI family DNA-binding transcriptional regulator n=1 Tax=Candidatus Pantoea formicae TaxID=2608355 RepID=A0ABX0R1Z4_9GAMM|nr:LacI family DNA-binding transcriptional regulator [Pantoea formicae]MDF7651286.1 LacI family DNA-binding transcriptional regulator [Erwiniaceae bacterium L1_54_3]NIF03245.1 LacI family DNA-binding transcriptional regulator [Pantoea formicae]
MAKFMSTKRVLLSDVAKLAGLSKATVSRYMNHSIVLPQETIDRIETAIHTLDYRGNSLARRLSKGGSETLGLVLPDITNPFFAELADAAEEAASARGYSLVLCITRNNPDKEAQFIRWLDTRQVDGLLFTTNRPDNGVLRAEIQRQHHVVLLDEDIPGSQVPKVFADNVQGGRIATEQLIAAGHTRIAFIGGPEQLMSVRERYLGFCTAMQQAGLAVPPEWVMYGNYAREFGQQALNHLFSCDQRPTAVFAASDYLVLGLLDGLRANGLQAPAALSLVGFDDANYTDLTQPRISTIRQPARELGHTAVNIMLRLLNNESDIPMETRLPVEWIGRDSIGFVNSVPK